MKIFFSWQSDVPKNKSYIISCLKVAISKSKDFEIDTATRNTNGSLEITNTIIGKIEKADLFIADVSIINVDSSDNRKVPNPNVMFELGYAAKQLGWERIILIADKKTTQPKELPFDVRNRIVIFTELNESNKNRIASEIRKCMERYSNQQMKKSNIEDDLEKIEDSIIELNKKKKSGKLNRFAISLTPGSGGVFMTEKEFQLKETERIRDIDIEIETLEKKRRFILDKIGR